MLKMKPTFSIITAVLNRRSDIVLMVNSVLSQRYANWQLVIVDNGSTDGTLEYCYSLQDPRIIVKECPTKGLAFARNVGVKNSDGEWLVVLDSDNEFIDEKVLDNLAEIVLKYKDVDVYLTLNENKYGKLISNLNGVDTNKKVTLDDYFKTTGEFSAIMRFDWVVNNLYPEINGAITEFPSVVYGKAARNQRLIFLNFVAQLYSTDSSNRICDQSLSKRRAWELMKYYELMLAEFAKADYSLPSARLVQACKYLMYKKLANSSDSAAIDLPSFSKLFGILPAAVVSTIHKTYSLIKRY